jgi:hypothetical protein
MATVANMDFSCMPDRPTMASQQGLIGDHS